MARIVKADIHAVKRNEILDAANRLVYSKGFDLMTIQDILDELRISKGAFYHYFGSKGAVMEALIERMVVEEMLPWIVPIVEDPCMSALEKFERYCATGVRWKTANKSLMLAMMRVWFADENVLVRQKTFDMTMKTVAPMLSVIIRQGIEEGVFNTPYPDETCRVMVYMIQGLGDTLIDLFFSEGWKRDAAAFECELKNWVAALEDSVERVLGAPKGSLKIVEVDTLMDWFKEEETIDQVLPPTVVREGISGDKERRETLVLQ